MATPAGGIICGLLVLLAALFLTPLFVYIPAACLGAVIVLAAVSMFDVDGIKHTWHVKRLDCLPLAATFILCFWDIGKFDFVELFGVFCVSTRVLTINGLLENEVTGTQYLIKRTASLLEYSFTWPCYCTKPPSQSSPQAQR